LSDRFLLDTHTWIWIALDSSRIRVSARERLKAEKSPLGVSAVSIYEAAILSRRGRVNLNIPTQAWFDLAFADASLNLLPVTPEIAIDAAMPADGFHGDPIDRILAATARVHNLVLCTHDEKLVRFGQQGVYKFLEV
jgi:PIN domain nuclease of toxin-antitoxin system